MLGAGLQFGRSRGEDRFYNPAKARRNRQNQLSQDHLRRAQSDVTVQSQPHPAKQKSIVSLDSRELENSTRREQESRRRPEETPKPVALPAVEALASPFSNLERFLESVTPSVPAQHLSKTTMRGWRTCDVEFQPYFVLADLWESFKEWSAYGAGVPLALNDSDCVVQYYVPYLSGIQLHVDPSKQSVNSRHSGEDIDSSSDGSSDSDRERCLNDVRKQRSQLTSKTPLRIDQLSLRDQRTSPQEGCSSDEGESGNAQGSLVFEYLERDQPYSREPLADKILDLALRFPELKTIRSCDLLSSSWISVAWYPIYRIPVGPTLRPLDACFLTFHSLHTPVSGSKGPDTPVVTYPSEIDGGIPKISLPVFGLASYKFKASWWTANGESERQLLNTLLQAAEKWLTMLQVNHPDFLFFSRR